MVHALNASVGVQRGPLLAAVPAPTRAPRDHDFDVLRGWAIVLMLFSHVGAKTAGGALAHLPYWISAADPFFWLSGAMLGMRAADGIAPAGVWQRARQFWLIHCVLMLAMLLVHEATGLFNSPSVAALGGAWAVARKLPLLRVQALDLMNILPLFAVFFALAPLLIRALRAGFGWLALSISAGLWLASQPDPSWVRFSDPACGPEPFGVLAWQFTFSSGVFIGYHQAALRAAFCRHPRLAFALLTAVVGSLFVLAQLQRATFGEHALRIPPALSFLVEKSSWGPVRALYVVALLIWSYVVLGLMRRRQPQLCARLLGPLELMGKNSLYCFLVHLVPALLASALLVDNWPTLPRELLPLLSIAFVYLMARRAVLARYLPR
ncbi:MAG TPA: OpgC domain-containing protein [Polyangiales bacterium]|nr:OpgC domain-containing protein [Polyangiales bacterium]